MILLELAAQGVRGVAPAGGRAALRPGYNVIAAEGAILRRLLEALLHPDAGDAAAIPRAGGPAGAPVRAGLTLIGDDRVTYRLVRDFAEGAQLHRFDGAQRTFALVAKDLGEIAAVLRDAGVPPPARADVLLALRAAELPSRQAARGLAAASRRQALAPDQARRRLEQLEAERARAQAVERVQRELDALQSRTFGLDEALRGGAALRDAVGRAEGARAALEPVARVAASLGDGEARLAVFHVATARRDDGLARLRAERAALADAEAAGAPAPFWRAPPFWAGLAGGAVVALAGLSSAAQPGLRTLALLDIPAFGWSAWLAVRWASASEAWERVTRRRRLLDDWEAKLEAQHARDGGEVTAALAALGLTRPDELREALARLAGADAELAAAREALASWEASPAARGAAAERARLEEEHGALEARLAAETGGGFVRDVRSVEQEVQRVEAEIAGAASPVSPVAELTAAADPLLALLERAGRALGASPAAAARAVGPRAGQALSGLCAQRLGGLEVDDRAGLHVAVAGRRTPVAQLPAADRDLVFVALKLALLERELAAGGRLALVDGALDALPEPARRAAALLLRQIARPGQIVHATLDPSFREAADHAAA